MKEENTKEELIEKKKVKTTTKKETKTATKKETKSTTESTTKKANTTKKNTSKAKEENIKVSVKSKKQNDVSEEINTENVNIKAIDDNSCVNNNANNYVNNVENNDNSDSHTDSNMNINSNVNNVVDNIDESENFNTEISYDNNSKTNLNVEITKDDIQTNTNVDKSENTVEDNMKNEMQYIEIKDSEIKSNEIKSDIDNKTAITNNNSQIIEDAESVSLSSNIETVDNAKEDSIKSTEVYDKEQMIENKLAEIEAIKRRHMNKEKVKIRILKMHVAYVEKRIIDDLRDYCGIENFNEWFKQEIEKDFTIVISNQTDIEVLTAIVRKRYYENIAEWVKERARKELLIHSPHTIFRYLDGFEK